MAALQDNHSEESTKANVTASTGHPPSSQSHTSQPTGVPSGVTYNVQSEAGVSLPPSRLLMTRPQPIPGVPPGLENLLTIDQLLIYQQVEISEAIMGWESLKKYQICNKLGQQVFFATEESDTCTRLCWGPSRGFTLHITDNFGQEVIRVTREFECCACGCCWCAGCDPCGYELRVEAPVGNVCGYARETTSGWKPCYVIQDANREDVLLLQGPCCYGHGICCTWDQQFKVFTRDRIRQVGVVSKHWPKHFTDADNFNMRFPVDLDVRMKAVALSAVFLIDFMIYYRTCGV